MKNDRVREFVCLDTRSSEKMSKFAHQKKIKKKVLEPTGIQNEE